jgi:hypothetical protein
VAIDRLSQLTEPATALTIERLQGYLVEAGKEFSFTGFSSYSALARRTLQLADRDDRLDGLPADDRDRALSTPDGTLVREIVGLIPRTEDFPCAWRFVRRDWTFGTEFRSLLGDLIDDEGIDGARLQRLIAIACGVPIDPGAEVVPHAYRRER